VTCFSDFVADTAYDQLHEHSFSFANATSDPKGAELGNDSRINPVRHKEEFSMWRHFPNYSVEHIVTITSAVATPPPGVGTIAIAPTADRGVGDGCQAIYRTGRTYLVSDREREELETAGWSFS
jgi:hypothetical protein